MRKVILAVCAAVVIFSCNMLTPMVASAAQNACPPHTMSATHAGTMVRFAYSHQYVIENGDDGPVYGTCSVYCRYDEVYLRCPLCGFIDYDHPVSSVFLEVDHHSACGL